MNIKFILIIIIIFLTFPFFCLARTYNANNIISDDLFRSQVMSIYDIQKFLESKGGFLASYQLDVFGVLKKPSEIIYDAARYYNVSEKILLTMLQKEQSLITYKTFDQYKLDWATGFGANRVNKESYQGFFNQVNWCAKVLGVTYDEKRGTGYYNYDVDKTTITTDGYPVTPENYSTAKLFIYNPVYGSETGWGGNYLFWDIYWNRWFGQVHPSGTLIQETGKAGVYLVENGKKKLIISPKILSSFADRSKVIIVSSNEIAGYGTGSRVKFNDGNLIRAPWGTVYVIEKGMRKGIPSKDAFYKLGYKWNFVKDVSIEEVNLQSETIPFDANHLIRASGSLVKIAEEPAVFLIENGKKKPIWHRSMLETNFRHVPIIDISREELDKYPLADPVKHKDGTLIKGSSNTVYVIENGKKRGFVSADIFRAMGYNWNNVITVPDAILKLYADGERIESY